MTYILTAEQAAKQTWLTDAEQTQRTLPAMDITTTTQRAGFATVERDGKTIGHVTRNDLIGSPNFGKWEARPVHDAMTVGKSFPLFTTRREAVEYVADNY